VHVCQPLGLFAGARQGYDIVACCEQCVPDGRTYVTGGAG